MRAPRRICSFSFRLRVIFSAAPMHPVVECSIQPANITSRFLLTAGQEYAMGKIAIIAAREQNETGSK